jgi:hypothetical protein
MVGWLLSEGFKCEPLWETVGVSQKIRELPCDPAAPHPKEIKAVSLRDSCTPTFPAALFTTGEL